jgi:AraC-like DNA-binding protein
MRKLIAPLNVASPPVNILAHLGFRSFLPHPHLQSWIQCYWAVQQPQLPAQGFSEKLYPDGGTNINFRFIPNHLPQVSFNAVQTLNTIHFQGNIDLLGIRFHPGGAFQLFGLDMPSLVGKHLAAEDLDTDLNNAHLHELRERLAQSDSTPHRIGLIDDWLLQQAAQHLAKQGPIQHLLPHLPNATESIETLSAQVNISRRQLERRFQQEVGLTLVHLKQLQRIRRARQLISLNPDWPLVDIAQEAGFYDQAHFIRQFQKVHQLTPGEYRNRKRVQRNQEKPEQ